MKSVNHNQVIVGLYDDEDSLGLNQIDLNVKVMWHIELGYPETYDSPGQPDMIEIDSWEIVDNLDHLCETDRQRLQLWVDELIVDEARDEIRNKNWEF